MQEKKLSFPNVATLYKECISQKTYRLMTLRSPKELYEAIAPIQHFILDYSSTPPVIESQHFWEYQLHLKAHEQEIFDILDPLRFEPFKNKGYIPLPEFTFNFLNFHFKERGGKEDLVDQLPKEYRAEILYYFIVKALYKENIESSELLFNSHLLFNGQTYVQEQREYFHPFFVFVSELHKKISPNNHLLYDYLARSWELMDKQRCMEFKEYTLSEGDFTTIDISFDTFNKPNYQNTIYLPQEVRSLFSYVQYAYLKNLSHLSENKKQSALTFFKDKPEFLFEEDFLMKDCKVNCGYDLIIHFVNALISIDMEHDLRPIPPSDKLCRVSFAWSEMINGDLAILPVLVYEDHVATAIDGRALGPFSSDRTLGFSRAITLKMQDLINDYLNEIIREDVWTSRCYGDEDRENPTYNLLFKKPAIDFFEKHYHFIQGVFNKIDPKLDPHEILFSETDPYQETLFELAWNLKDCGLILGAKPKGFGLDSSELIPLTRTKAMNLQNVIGEIFQTNKIARTYANDAKNSYLVVIKNETLRAHLENDPEFAAFFKSESTLGFK